MILSPDQKIAGILAPLFALRSENDLGIGDLAALRQLVDWARKAGFRLVQLLPINETGNDNSPYNAISSVAIDPATLEVTPESISDLARADFEKICADNGEARSTGTVNYRAVKKLKGALLESAFAQFSKLELSRNTSRARQFRQFVKEAAAWLDGYAFFRALMEKNNGSERWDQWPEHQRTVAAARAWLGAESGTKRKEFERRMRFFQYVQWIAFSQWRTLHEHCEKQSVALMGDVPFGVSYYSADVYSNPELFDLKWSSGAPPEPYFKDDEFTQKWGQNWGMPLYRWEVMRENNFAWWRQRVRMVREMFDLFRIDHVLGFFRIYCFPWRPEKNWEFLPCSVDEARMKTGGDLPHFAVRDDSTAENREANRQQGEEFLKVLIEEVGTHRLVGEDLGVVPDYVRPNLESLGIAGFKIPIWEHRQDGGLVAGGDYQRLSVATYATHDHEPLRALWDRWLMTGQVNELRQLAQFADFSMDEPPPWSEEIHERMLRALFASNSWIAICMITDLFASVQRFNVPGAFAESNWSERLPESVAQWLADENTNTKIERVKRTLRETGRT